MRLLRSIGGEPIHPSTHYYISAGGAGRLVLVESEYRYVVGGAHWRFESNHVYIFFVGVQFLPIAMVNKI